MTNLSFGFANPLKERFGEEFFKALPQEAGVYFFLDSEKRPLYIGKADCLKKRLASYKNAKPGQAPEHILEMLEHAESIIWETHRDGAQALRRESELIRSLLPPFNIAGTDPAPYLFCGIKSEKKTKNSNGLLNVEFRLSHNQMPIGFETFGCFSHRGKTKAGYSAVLRLLWVSTIERERFHLPAKLCRTSPAYIHRAQVPGEWMVNLVKFLRGESPKLLQEITTRLLERDHVPAHLYAPVQRDLQSARDFYQIGPQSTRRLARSSGVRRPFITQKQMKDISGRKSRASFASLIEISI
jgi:excinuclease UvrABC nuclease subunit